MRLMRPNAFSLSATIWKHALLQHSTSENHEWLHPIYKLRKQWVPAFYMHIFSTGMSTSQRVESALRHRRHKELASNVDVNEVPKLKTLFPIENKCVVYIQK